MRSEIIVISGVSRGLGRAMTEEFIRLGHRVFGCGRSVDAIGELNSLYGPDSRFEVVDVANDDAVRDWAAHCLGLAGSPDLLLNNAALVNHNALLWEVPASEFSAIVDVNIKGVANVIRHFVPAMVARQSGVIVNFSSGWGRSTDMEVAPYCATKWAIEGLTKALAQELPKGHGSHSAEPGYHRYRHAAQHFRITCAKLSICRGMGQNCGAMAANPGCEGQRTLADSWRAPLMSI